MKAFSFFEGNVVVMAIAVIASVEPMPTTHLEKSFHEAGLHCY